MWGSDTLGVQQRQEPHNMPPVCAQVMKKKDLIRKNMVESVTNERNILAMANNPFVVGCQAQLPPGSQPVHSAECCPL